ncbi:MAG: hypothetical protein IPO40_00230 [Fibrobacteres bacterium]|nr:hypothetical protein [Fibrobacterota bacterium]
MRQFPLPTLLTLCLGAGGHTYSAGFSGTVLAVNATPLAGVVVRHDGIGNMATTDGQGHWSIPFDVAVEPRLRTQIPPRPASHLEMESGRLRVDFGSSDAQGRQVRHEPEMAGPAIAPSPRAMVAAGVNHLEYSWQGKVFLRDTISPTVSDRQGMVRRFDTAANPDFAYGYVQDTHDRFYRTTKIGNQVWMAENLDVATDSSWCFGNSRDSCDRYGRLYQWASAMSLADSCLTSSCSEQIAEVHRGICPVGWHVPSDKDWTRLGDTIIGTDPGTVLKSAKFWRLDEQADLLGFGALAGGWRPPPDFVYTTQVGYWWSASIPGGGYAWYRKIVYLTENLTRDSNPKNFGYSLRCLMDP